MNIVQMNGAQSNDNESGQNNSKKPEKPLRFVTNYGAPHPKRRRIGAACLTCRKRKTACSGKAGMSKLRIREYVHRAVLISSCQANDHFATLASRTNSTVRDTPMRQPRAVASGQNLRTQRARRMSPSDQPRRRASAIHRIIMRTRRLPMLSMYHRLPVPRTMLGSFRQGPSEHSMIPLQLRRPTTCLNSHYSPGRATECLISAG